MRIDVFSLFPEMVEAAVSDSILKRARDLALMDIRFHQFRDFANNKHRKVDDAPYGGGAGLVMCTEPVDNALRSVRNENSKVIYFSPKGYKLDQKKVVHLSKSEHLIMLCGHYEGFDQRIIDQYVDEEISIGDYVLTGGELPAAVTIDAISRYIKGVLGKSESLEEESFTDSLLEYPHYTRPENYNGMKVPEILLSGHHGKVDEWRYKESIELTFKRRKDLLLNHVIQVLKTGKKSDIKALSSAIRELEE